MKVYKSTSRGKYDRAREFEPCDDRELYERDQYDKGKRVAVFCGSTGEYDEELSGCAATLGGLWIGEYGRTLIYGGGDSGLMGDVAWCVQQAEGYVIGVVPGNIEFISSRPQNCVDKLIIADDMSERKKIMIELADGFVALPGGIGTMEEIFDAISAVKLGAVKKPCVFLNFNGFYNPLKDMLANMEKAGFIKQNALKYVCFADNNEEASEFLKNFGV